MLGVDSQRRNAQNMKMSPPRIRCPAYASRPRSASRAAVGRADARDAAQPRPRAAAGGINAMPAVSFDGFLVAFDPASGLPARVRTLDYDNIWGDVNYDVVFSNWRDVGGVKIPI